LKDKLPRSFAAPLVEKQIDFFPIDQLKVFPINLLDDQVHDMMIICAHRSATKAQQRQTK
jgi:hypothetical protein